MTNLDKLILIALAILFIVNPVIALVILAILIAIFIAIFILLAMYIFLKQYCNAGLFELIYIITVISAVVYAVVN